MNKRLTSLVPLSLLLTTAVVSGTAGASESRPEGARAYIISPSHGDTVPETFVVRFGLKGMGVAPVGCEQPGTGHHHLLIDHEELPPPDQPLQGEHIQHFGAGQTQTKLTLPPGEHTLLLILGDKDHIPHSPPVMSEQIRVTVE